MNGDIILSASEISYGERFQQVMVVFIRSMGSSRNLVSQSGISGVDTVLLAALAEDRRTVREIVWDLKRKFIKNVRVRTSSGSTGQKSWYLSLYLFSRAGWFFSVRALVSLVFQLGLAPCRLVFRVLVFLRNHIYVLHIFYALKESQTLYSILT